MSTSTSISATPDIMSPRVPSLNNTYGAILIGTFVGLMIYGLTLHQTYRYFYMYREDKRFLKILVIALFITDTFHSVLCMHICYHSLVTSFLNPGGLLDVNMWSFQSLIPASSAIAMISQGFYAHRVYSISSKHIYVVIIVVLCLLCEIALGIGATLESFKRVPNAKLLLSLASLGAIPVMLLTDIMLTGTLIAYLRRSRTGIRRTDSMLNILVIYTINTGLLTSTISLATLVLALVQPDKLIYTGVSVVIMRCYVNAVLATLNARRSIRARGQNFAEFGTFGMVYMREAARAPPSSLVFRLSEPHSSSGTAALPSHADTIQVQDMKLPAISRPITRENSDTSVGAESSREKCEDLTIEELVRS